MNKERIEKIRKSLNIDDRLQFAFAEELGLWIIGGYGPVDIQEELADKLLSIPDYAKIKELFRPYLTREDAKEGFHVCKFNTPFWSGDRELSVVDIYFIQCTNNGISYFACSNLDALRSFTLCANEGIR